MICRVPFLRKRRAHKTGPVLFNLTMIMRRLTEAAPRALCCDDVAIGRGWWRYCRKRQPRSTRHPLL